MKELNRITVGLIALRFVQNEELSWCEIFEAGKWVQITANKADNLCSDERIKDWLALHFDASDNIIKFPDKVEHG